MNLLELLRQEIKKLPIQNDLIIAKYIYVRTGELFCYNPQWIIATSEELQQIKKQTVDIRNVTSFEIICYSWAQMYQELLQEFGISAKVIHEFCHDYVEFLYNNEIVHADLTKDYYDITFAKLDPSLLQNFYIGSPKRIQSEIQAIDHLLGYERHSLRLSILKQAKRNLQTNFSNNSNEYYSTFFQTIEHMLNFMNQNVDYISGRKYIQYLFHEFLDRTQCSYEIYHVSNHNEHFFAELYLITIKGQTYYFTYQPMNQGAYYFQEVSKGIIDYFFLLPTFNVKQAACKKAMDGNLKRVKC